MNTPEIRSSISSGFWSVKEVIIMAEVMAMPVSRYLGYKNCMIAAAITTVTNATMETNCFFLRMWRYLSVRKRVTAT